jgi:hypothetical protein
VPLATRNHTPIAEIGTAMYLLTPKMSMDPATPANSVVVLAMSATRSPAKMRAVIFTPAFSRMRSASPLPVTMPMRAFISCTMNSTTAQGIRAQM